MSIILKHIIRNIKEHKVRSFLIFLALLISTSVLIINIVLPDEIFVKIEDTFRTIYGDSDVAISSVDKFKYEDLNVDNTKLDYMGTSDLVALNEKDKITTILGMDIKKAKEFRLLGNDVPELKDNEVVINQYSADLKGYKKGDKIKIKYNDIEYEFIIKEIIKKTGLAAIENENDIFITNIETVNKIEGIENTYRQIYFNIEDEDKIDDFIKYLKDHNENYNAERTIDLEGLKEELSFVRTLMTLIFFMSTVMIFFVIGSLNKIMLAERIPVIGTFRSIGADRKKMNTILLVENGLYGLFAGLAGSFAGIYLDSIVSKTFVVTEGVELSSKSVSISPTLIIIGTLFAILLQLFITAKEIIRTNKKPIKTLIFNTQNSRYKVRKGRTIIGFILLVVALISYLLNTKIDILITMITLVSLVIGIANIVPFLLQKISLLLAAICKKIGWSSGIIASKNIGYNKMIISSSRLIVVSLSLLSTIVLVSNSITKVFTAFREVTKDYDIIVSNVSYNEEKYDELENLDEVKKVDYLYYYYDEKITYNDDQKFKAAPIIYATKIDAKYIETNKIKVKDLKKDEIIIDEKIAIKNNLKVGDKIKINFNTLEKSFEFKIVELSDSSLFTTSRNVIAINYELFKEELTDTPIQLHIITEDNVDLEKFKDKLKDEIKEVNLKVQTVEEYISMQEQQSGSILGIFYVILGLSVFLSFIGIVNNQIISFLQRRREIAVLNSTCMSKSQLRKMLLTETVLANLIASILVIIVSYISVNIIDNFMQGIDMYINVRYNIQSVLTFIGIVYVILLFTLIIPIRKLKKLKIVNEIKYE